MSPSITVKAQGGKLRRITTDCFVSDFFKPIPADPTTGPKYTALWDTGATGTVITAKVVADLGLNPTTQEKVYHAQGHSMTNVYWINLALPNRVHFTKIKVSEGVLSGMDVLIGMDIITHGDFSITNFNGNTVFSFRVPSEHEVDYVAAHTLPKSLPQRPPVSRNEKCPCGSGKKYKQCHGGPRPPASPLP